MLMNNMKNKNLFVILIISFFLILILGWMLRKITVERNMYKDVFSQLSTQDCQITESLYDQLKYDEICWFKSEGTLINSAINIRASGVNPGYSAEDGAGRS